jgi:uncharacterized membrane protein
MTLKITSSEQLLSASGLVDGDAYSDWVYCYYLTDEGTPFYCGTTTNPTTRLLGHLNLATKDTKDRIRAMMEKGVVPEMVLVDITSKEHRYVMEARWINSTPNVINSTRYASLYEQWQSCPTCYRAVSEGTLRETIPLPATIPSKERGKEFKRVLGDEGRERAREMDQEAWAYWRRWEAQRN